MLPSNYDLIYSKTKQTGDDNLGNTKPILGRVAIALNEWLNISKISEGAIFRKVFKGGKTLSKMRLNEASINKIVKNRCSLAGVVGNFSAHSLRSGFVTEAEKQEFSLAETMSLTGHKNISSVLKYYRTEINLKNKVDKMMG